jgi:hypothetical protein
MLHRFIRLLVFFIFCKTCSSQLSDKTDVHKLLNTNENKDTLYFVAVFLLTTLEGSAELGDKSNRDDFFQRVRAAKETWAHPIKHFYAVVGKQSSNDRIIKDTKYCQDHTHHYREITKHIKDATEEVYVCNGIRVLYLPYCNPSSWGPMVFFCNF